MTDEYAECGSTIKRRFSTCQRTLSSMSVDNNFLDKIFLSVYETQATVKYDLQILPS